MMIRGLNKITDASGLGYMMSSYTSHPGGPAEAKADAQRLAASLTICGLVVFAPIAYGPEIEQLMLDAADTEDHNYLKSHEFWMPICERFYSRCDYGVICTTPGWQRSKGIAIEIYALACESIPIFIFDTNNMRLLHPMEAEGALRDDFQSLVDLAVEVGGPGYLAQLAEGYSQGLGVGISELRVDALMGEDDE